MSGAPELERSVLERKERNELHVIAESLGLKPGSRTKKADLIDKILLATGVDIPSSPNGSGPSANGDAPAVAAVRPMAPPFPSELVPAADPMRTGEPAERPEPERPEPERPEPPAMAAPDPNNSRAEQADRGEEEPDPADRNGQGERGGPNQTHAQPQGLGQPQSTGGPRQNNQRQGGPAPNTQQNQARQDWNRGGETEAGNRNSRRRRRGRDRSLDRDLAVQERLADQPYTGDPVDVEGFLDLRDEGFGFVRTTGFLASPKDVYVSVSQARRFGLRRGDFIIGAARPANAGEKFPALLRIDTVSGMTAEDARNRPRFEDLTPLFPDQKLKMETPGDPGNITSRIVDLLCPIGKGQRGLIVSPPKAGKTTVIKQIAHSIETNNPDVHLIVLLVDERPEEVTDMRRTVKGEVIASTFDRPSDEHTQVAELALERAKRLVEEGRDVVIILDGITRLTRAYNLSAPASGRLTSGGIDQAAIYPPKKFFGAARNAEEGGSLTILATALVETGSKADDVIFEELKGTGNMELRLDRRLAERRLYPAIDVNASSTRHEELLFERGTLQLVWRLRRVLNGLGDDGGSSWKALELLMDKIKTTKSNDEFLAEVSKTQTPV